MSFIPQPKILYPHGYGEYTMNGVPSNLTTYQCSSNNFPQIPTLTIAPKGEHIIVIDKHGDIFWKGRKIESDDDFKKAMLELKDALVTRYHFAL